MSDPIYQCFVTDDDDEEKDDRLWMDVKQSAYDELTKRDDVRGRVVYSQGYVDALAAQVEGMRSAANRYLDHDGSRGVFDALELSKARGELDKALTLTPPASLALHDAEVLEQLGDRLSTLADGFMVSARRAHWLEAIDTIKSDARRIRAEAGRDGDAVS